MLLLVLQRDIGCSPDYLHLFRCRLHGSSPTRLVTSCDGYGLASSHEHVGALHQPPPCGHHRSYYDGHESNGASGRHDADAGVSRHEDFPGRRGYVLRRIKCMGTQGVQKIMGYSKSNP
jgi:hypothetical protein